MNTLVVGWSAYDLYEWAKEHTCLSIPFSRFPGKAIISGRERLAEPSTIHFALTDDYELHAGLEAEMVIFVGDFSQDERAKWRARVRSTKSIRLLQ